MTANRRIFLNIVATYGRSLFSLACGLFTSRWILMSLGAVDYGLYGLVGGIIGFVTFFNSVLSQAVGRFYAYEVGKASKVGADESALEECRAWFSTSVFLHSALATLLVAIGWPLGEYAVRHWLTIPPDRVVACLWVFRFSILACFVSMVNVPFNAMYTAKQYIAELTIYSVVATAVRVVLLYYMVTHPADWLVGFGLMMMVISVVPNLLIAYRACVVFPECRLRPGEMVSTSRMRQLGQYAGWEMFGMTAWTCRQNSTPIFINEFLGAAYNSSMTVANAIAGHTVALSSCLTTAFAPAIVNAHGAGNDDQMKAYAYRASKIGTLLMLLFAVPICLELEKIMVLWLAKPPPGIAILARYVLLTLVLDRLAAGQHLAVCATGKIGRYQVVTSIGIVLFLPIVWILLLFGWGLHAVGVALVTSFALNTVLRAIYASNILNERFVAWLTRVLLPCSTITLIAFAIGYLPHLFLSESILRILLTGIVSTTALFAISLFMGLDAAEKSYLLQKLHLRRAS